MEALVARFFHPLILMLASLGKPELARHIQYLKAENEILRAKLPKRVDVTPLERRRLLRLGGKIGPALKHLITIVSYRTFLRWVAGDKVGRAPGKAGRPKTDRDIREIIVRLSVRVSLTTLPSRRNRIGRLFWSLRKLPASSCTRTSTVSLGRASHRSRTRARRGRPRASGPRCRSQPPPARRGTRLQNMPSWEFSYSQCLRTLISLVPPSRPPWDRPACRSRCRPRLRRTSGP